MMLIMMYGKHGVTFKKRSAFLTVQSAVLSFHTVPRGSETIVRAMTLGD